MATFKIEKPKTLMRDRVGYFLTRIFFPPLLLWDLLKNWATKRWGSKIGTFIFQASQIDFSNYGLPKDWKSQADQQLKMQSEVSHAFHTVVTHDGAELDTLDIIHKSQQLKPIHEQKFVIYFNGNAGHYAASVKSDLLENVLQDKYNQVCFNYRGTNQQGKAPDIAKDLVTDGIAQVQRLLNQGVLPENIILRGQSLGGAIAAKVGQHFHAHKAPVRVYNERSFSTTTKVAVGYIRKGKDGQPQPFWIKVLGYVAYPLISMALHLTSWEINAAKAFKSIPQKDRDYTVIRTLKLNRTPDHKDDNIIPHYASMHEALSDERRSLKRELKKLQKKPLENLEKKKELERKLKGVKMGTTTSVTDAHNVEPRDPGVKNKYNQTLHQRFSMFAKKSFNAVDPSVPKSNLAPSFK